ncbi:hypothetical protein K505DRAFT_137946 [Melanomma pulvis-pyrius CBS 109.77]|uniref:Uncharacterized protein n=1 Tax=Melanomma pulvis-pyrius CBS 109.77 TaxID=1314802 RepID=A0A6A6WSC2_9PLEO|nr:hypothetical protein K505DRAFT_137946 [Melanomma pulvis-pyrius CBS 109.77]
MHVVALAAGNAPCLALSQVRRRRGLTHAKAKDVNECVDGGWLRCGSKNPATGTLPPEMREQGCEIDIRIFRFRHENQAREVRFGPRWMADSQ